MKARRWQRLLLSLCLICLIGWSFMMMDAAALQKRLVVHLALQVGSSGSAGDSESLQPLAGSLIDSSECSDANPPSCKPSRADIVIRAEVRTIVSEQPEGPA